jgi:polyhydroxyalkanoate synthesis regulator phasin
MPIYRIKAPNGKTYRIEGPPGASDADVARAVIAQFPEAGQAPAQEPKKEPVETTTFGQIKEFGKGLVPGAVGLVESAAVGASALLPEDMEKSARESIKSVATAAKSPFAATAGYEDSVGRKFGEATGSTLPFLAAGPMGWLGRAGALALGTGAGAGEARTRAEEAGATDEQRSTATALGIIPGAAEMLAPIRIFRRLPDAVKADGIQRVRRALQAGGEEAAQEAASGWAQNLIAQQIYKPEQELIEGLGEQAAYGGAVGALLQGVMDLAIGRRDRGTAAATEEQAALEEQALAGRAAREQQNAPVPEVAPVVLPENLSYEALTLAREDLRQQEQTPDTIARVEAITKRLQDLGQADVTARRTAKQNAAKDSERAKQSAFAQDDQTVQSRESVLTSLAERQAAAAAPTETAPTAAAPAEAAPVNMNSYSAVVLERERVRALPKTRENRARIKALDARATELVKTGLADREKASQSAFSQPDAPVVSRESLDDPAGDTGTPTTTPDPDGITLSDLQGIGQPMGIHKKWFINNVVGKTPAQVQALVAEKPKLIEGKDPRAKVLREILAPVPPSFVEAKNDPTPAEPAAPQATDTGAGARLEPATDGTPNEPSLGAPVGESAPTDTAGAEASDGARVVPTRRNARTESAAPAAPADPVSDTDALFDRLVRAVRDPKSPDYAEAGQVLEANRNNPQFLEQYDRAARRQGLAPDDATTDTDVPEVAFGNTTDDVATQIKELEATQMGLLSKGGRRPAATTPKRKQYDELTEQIGALRERWGQLDAQERAAKAAKPKKAKAPKAAPAERSAPKAPTAADASFDQLLEALQDPDSADYERAVAVRDSNINDPAFKAGLARAKSRQAGVAKPSAAEMVESMRADKDNQEFMKRMAEEGPRLFNLERAPSLSRGVSAARRQLNKGKITPEQFAERVGDLQDQVRDAKSAKDLPKRVRGSLFIRERLLEGVRNGWITEEGASMAEWFIKQNPALVDGLGISFKTSKTEGVAGSYNAFNRVMELAKGSDSTDTATHEILHHLERMMPDSMQDAIRSAWLTSLTTSAKKARAAKDADVEKYYQLLIDYHLGTGPGSNVSDAMQLIIDGKVDYDHYQHTNASEFWAVNGSRILDGRFAVSASMAGRIKKWLTEMLERLKAILGMQSDTAVLRALDSLIKGDGQFITGQGLLGGGSRANNVQQSRQSMKPSSGKEFSEIVASSAISQGQPGVFADTARQLGEMFFTAEGVTFGDRFRTLSVDNMASVESKLNRLFDGAVRSSKGILNPMGLNRQAQDTGKLLAEWFRGGALVKNATTNTYESSTKPGVPSMEEVLTDVQSWAKSRGLSTEVGMAQFSKMLEALRLDSLRGMKRADGKPFSINKLSLKDPRSADAQIDFALKEYAANPSLALIRAKMDTMRFELIDQMVAAGRLSKAEGKEWREATNYVPFDRIEDFATKYRSAKRGGGGGIAQLGRMPELVSTTEREVGDVLNNFAKTAGWMVNQVVKQDATKSTLELMEDIGYATRVGPNGSSIPAELRVQTFENGEPVFYKVQSRWDMLAFKDLAEPKGVFVKAMSGASNFLRKTITSMPPFAVRQVVNDIQRAFATSGVQNPYMLILPTLRNFVSISFSDVVLGRPHASVREFGRKGITGDYDFNTNNPMDSVMYDLGLKSRGPLKGLIHRLDGITRASDLAVRKAIHDRTLVESKGDTLLANTRAREFINFRRRGAGAAIPALVATIPFFNAYLQGMDVLYRAITGKGASASVNKAAARRLFASKAMTMATFSAIYSMLMSGDDDYEEADLRTRHNNWLLPGGYKLPVPEELGAIYKVPVEMTLEFFRRNGTAEDMEAAEASITALKYMFEQYIGRTVPIPAAIKPVMEAWTNYSFFTGESLEGTYQKELVSSQRVRTNTSELARSIAQFTSTTFGEGATISPIKIDNFLQGYFGSLAGLVTMTTDQAINPDRMDRPMAKYWMLSNFLYDPVGTRRVNEFYDFREKVIPKLNTLNKLAKEDPEAAVKYMEENEQDLILAQSVNTAIAQLSDTRAHKNYLTSSKAAAESMTQEERRAELDEVRRMEVALVSWLREARVLARDQ